MSSPAFVPEASEQRQEHASVALNANQIGVALLSIAFVLALVLSLAASPRRTGDAHQYIAMALQFAEWRPPSLSRGDEASYRTWLQSQPMESGFPDGARAVRQPALIREDRQEFSHFWLYPLLATPALTLTSMLGAHPLVAFTITNAFLLGSALVAATRVFGALAALFVLASPVVWFLSRAQVELFTLSLILVSIAAAASGRWGWASIAIAIAATQNPPIAATIPLFWTGAVVEWRLAVRTRGVPRVATPALIRRALAFAVASIAITLIHPAYYVMRLGVVTPQQLNGGIAGIFPSWNRYFAPLLDPDIGFLAWMPFTAALTFAGGVLVVRTWSGNGRENDSKPGVDAMTLARSLRTILVLAVCLAMAMWFLFVFAQTTNVNSGGTVHISRYALWLLPLTLPALAMVTQHAQKRAPALAFSVGVLLISLYFGYFQPDQPERYVEHSPQANWLMSHHPTLYQPLPEVFVERTLHIDGGPLRSAASESCQTILVVAARPEQPCELREDEKDAGMKVLAKGFNAFWIRRGTQAQSDVEPALLTP